MKTEAEQLAAVRELIAEANWERSFAALSDIYDGLENVPAKLLDDTWQFELDFADYLLSLTLDGEKVLLVRHPDQGLPDYGEPIHKIGSPHDFALSQLQIAQRDMKEAGWVRVIRCPA